jgi:hypothetical protein
MNKEELKANAKQQIDEVFTKLDEMEAKSGQVSAEMKQTYNEQLDKLRTKKKELDMKYAELQQASEDKVEELGQAFSESKNYFKEGYRKLNEALS